MRIVVIDYKLGNIHSIINMLKRIGVDAKYSNVADEIHHADKLILPGVGAFDHAMQALEEIGLIDVLNEAVIKNKKPILGICLGMQLLLEGSEEGRLKGLGWIKGYCRRFKFPAIEKSLKVPHMGWNVVKSLHPNPLLPVDITDETRFYFVHSYHAICENKADILGTTHYGFDFSALIGRDHIFGAQFHPEKSHKYGMQLLKNFIEYKT